MDGWSPIEDYALIGDCHTAALVARDGSIDRLCLPRFDSGACFAALLGNAEHGFWRIAPAAASTVTRSYRGDTLVLETRYVTATGEVVLTDFMPPRSSAADVVRIVDGVRGEVELRMDLRIRLDYGSVIPWVRRTEDGISAVGGPDAVRLRTRVPLVGKDFATVASFTVAAGQRVTFDLTWHPSHQPPPPALDPSAALEETASWWAEWAGRSLARGPWREEIVRSLITLKALT